MTKIIWMSDPHFQNEGTIGGLDPRVRLRVALDHANSRYPDAAFCVLSGDLVGDDVEGDYRALAGILNGSALRVYPMMGNNDARAAFRAQLDLPQSVMPEFIQYEIETDEAVLLCLDTHKVGSHAGEFCAARRAWLTEALRRAGARPVYIFMHHPPLALGLPKQDEIMLEEGDAFLDLIAGHGSVRHLFMGHVHRATCGSARGIPFATLGSLAFQAPPPRPDWDWDSFAPAPEAPQYAVLDIAGGDVTLQYIQFCEYSVGLEG